MLQVSRDATALGSGAFFRSKTRSAPKRRVAANRTIHSSRLWTLGSRLAFSLPELIIALTLLAAATAVMMPLMLAVSNQRRAADQRQRALVQAENALDLLLSAAKPDATEADLLRQWTEFEQPASAGAPALRDLERRVIVADRAEDQARQLTVELRWKNHAGQFTTPVRLSAWQFPSLETQP